MPNLPSLTKEQLVNIFALVLISYLTWKMYELHVLKNRMDSVLRTKNTNHLFFTRAYDLLINGVRTTNGILAVDRRPYFGNDANLFLEDVEKYVINTVIIAGQPYRIRFYSKDSMFFKFKIQNMCSIFPLSSCSNGLDIESRITKFVHALGMNVMN